MNDPACMDDPACTPVRLVIPPLAFTWKTLVPPFAQKSRKFPVNPEGALMPNSVPAVLNAVGPAPSLIYTRGNVVVPVPPVYSAPVIEIAGVDAAPALLYVQGAVVENAPVCALLPARIALQFTAKDA